MTINQMRINFPVHAHIPREPMSTEKPKKEARLEMRVDESWLKRIDDWRRKQDEIPSRAEALRRLTDIGLQQAS